ncbi:DUF6402 family protein [Xenorhabdus doucetiae]|uniref:Uncharacterized protein n=1 Tax=Xenorhabdus doucetiae TaxID=351671 RepID=A0A068QQY6_9GAMM|nr:DUF6402 family protein [Xenorhabdus doucetiae]TYO97059.1 hypothetical protein LY16_03405 [Xenorhabdus doucetiae]CDG17383.1 conserved protein of unknown function [Xenorhabdus doucetiae]
MSILKTKTVKGGANTDLEYDKISLNQLPDIMNKMGWEMASKLMREWFNRPLFEMDDNLRKKYILGKATDIPKEHYNDSIVKMEWALKYERVQDAINELIITRLGNDKSNGRLFGPLLERNKEMNPSSNKIYIGYNDDIIDIDFTTQINSLDFGGKFDTNDDFKGAIGASNMELCVRGYYDLSQKKKKFLVDQIGFFIKDAYNFSGGHEPLGIWGREGMLPLSESPKYLTSFFGEEWGKLYREYYGFVPVFNRDFREWQKIHGEGGDYIVFSDVHWMAPPAHLKVMYENS